MPWTADAPCSWEWSSVMIRAIRRALFAIEGVKGLTLPFFNG
jgi:hypothetical protein